MQRKQASEFDQRVLDLYDDYAHGRIGRRDFLETATKFAVGRRQVARGFGYT
jgi:carboxymethylenebutenolidase